METNLPADVGNSVELDSERQQQAREYARIKRRISFVNLSISTVGVLVLLLSGLGIWLRDSLRLAAWLLWQPLSGWFPWQILAYFLLIALVYELITLPLSYYSGYLLPRRYKLSTLSLSGWIRDLLKGMALGLVLEAFVVELIYALLALQPASWWLWVA